MDKTKQPYRQRLEARMIEIAERLIESEGLAAVQARRVTQQADCSIGTLYNVFGGLDGLIIAANTRTLHRLGDTLETAARSSSQGGLEEQLVALAFAYRDFVVEHNQRWRALFEHRMAADSTVPQDYRAEQGKLFVLVELMIERFVPDAGERQSAARALFSAVHGIVLLSLDSKLEAYDAAETERQIRFIVSNAARGLEAGRR